MIDYQVARNWDFADIVHTYALRDTMLYALGIGMGADPMDEAELAFVIGTRAKHVPGLGRVLRRRNRARAQRFHASTAAASERLSNDVYQRIEHDPEFYRELI